MPLPGPPQSRQRSELSAMKWEVGVRSAAGASVRVEADKLGIIEGNVLVFHNIPGDAPDRLVAAFKDWGAVYRLRDDGQPEAIVQVMHADGDCWKRPDTRSPNPD